MKIGARKRKRILFFLVHPAKYHLHRVQIRELSKRGHRVDVVIVAKDILEDLVKEDGWQYTNLFPNGRKIKGLHIYLSSAINLLTTVYRLARYTRCKRYDLFIGDALTMLGRLLRVPSLYPMDDGLDTIPQQEIFWLPTTRLIAPDTVEMGKYEPKTVHYKGYKALAHLHPNHFTPDRSKLDYGLADGTPFFLLRLSEYSSYHDLGRKGVDDEILTKLIPRLEPHGKVLISAERKLPPQYEKHRIEIRKRDICHYLYFAQLFIGDSTTMAAEAAVLGTPAIEFDDWWEITAQQLELQDKYGLIHGVKTSQPEALLAKVDELLALPGNLKDEFLARRDKMLAEKIDVSAFLIWYMENYPESDAIMKSNPDYQDGFIHTPVADESVI